ncbi:RHS repeat domain-containing protein [Shewanella putrefaciens]|uniref:RHS repeat domain-containing protein n=1 Tax=Shewanella putrefaciens TaxID=24 RepID=UPI0035688F21
MSITPSSKAAPYQLYIRSVTQPSHNSTAVVVNYMCIFTSTGYCTISIGGRVAQTVPSAYASTFTFDYGAGWHTVRLASMEPNGFVNGAYTYGETKHLIASIVVTAPSMTEVNTSYIYDALGRLIQVDDQYNTTEYQYDNANNRTSKKVTD